MTRTGEYADWAKHLGKSTLDETLIAEFRRAGFENPPVIQRDDFEESVMDGHMTISVRDPESFGRGDEFGDGVGILAVITMHVLRAGKPSYSGPLPFSINHEDSRSSLRQKLGDPDEEEEDDFLDVWYVDDLELVVTYTEDFDKIEAVAVCLPEAE